MKLKPPLTLALNLVACVTALAACRLAAGDQVIRVEPGIRHLRSGELLEFEVRVSLPGEGRGLSLGWEFELGGAVLARGECALEVADGESRPVTVQFQAPQVRHPCDVGWRLCVTRLEEEQAHRALRLRVYPAWDPQPLQALLSEGKVAVADPSGRPQKLLADHGLAGAEVSTAAAVRAFDGAAIMLGPGAAQAPGLVEAALEAAMAGRTVVWFEPGDTSPWREPFGLPRSFACEPTARISLAAQHPVLFSLVPEDLNSWRENVASLLMAEPCGGNFRGLVAGNGEKAGFGILELFPGSGRIVLCALPVVSCFEAEPVAPMLFESLLRYALSDMPPFHPASLWAPPESQLHVLAEAAGIVLGQAAAAPESVLIIAADEGATQYAQSREPWLPEKIRAYLHKGGKCLLIGAEPGSAAFLERCGLRDVAFAPVAEETVLAPQPLPLTWGFSSQRFSAAARACEGGPLFRFAATAKDGDVAVAPGAIVKVRVGEGEAILCQLALDRAPEDHAVLAVFRQLMTNLGVRLQLKDEQ